MFVYQKLMKSCSVVLISLILVWVFSYLAGYDVSIASTESSSASEQTVDVSMLSASVNAPNFNPPSNTVKLVFIHHSVGDNWLETGDGDLGDTLGANNYYVSETFYDWGPDSIGSTTDIGDWWSWFRGSNSSTYLSALYASDYQHASYSRPMTDPGGENEVIMFKSCYPNSYMDGEPDDPPTVGENPLRGQPASSDYHNVANAKGIYNDILEYFETRQDKLFIVITAPPIRYTGYDAIRGFNNWLVYDWLDNYPYNNVAVFDFFNIMTTNGGDYDTNDFGLSTGNHHRLITTTTPMTIEHIYDGDDDANPHLLEYPSDGGSDSHPTSAGNQKATGEFIPLLNVYYNCWKYGQCVGATTGGITLAGSNPDQSVLLGETAVYALSITANDGFSEPVTLTLQDAPAGTSHSFVPNYGSPPSASDLIISTTTSTPLGTHLMTVIADGVTVQDTLNLTMTVNLVNSPPLANDDSTSTAEGTPLTIDVAANDSDPDSNLDPTSANTICATCADPVHGMLLNNGDGTFTYDPEAGFTGPDSFVYEICDSGGLCDTAVVNITVTPSNDPPVANNDEASMAEDTAVMVNVTVNDIDPDGNLDTSSTNTDCPTCAVPSNGSLVNYGDGTIEYAPNPDYNGPDSFVYEICDTFAACDTALVDITVYPVNDLPVANDDAASTDEDTVMTINVVANDSDPDGNLNPASTNTSCVGCANPGSGSLVNHGDGTIEYAPNAGFTGPDNFVYEVCDTDLACDTAQVNITVNPSAPIIVEVRISASSDDAEERSAGSIYLTSSDLELVFDGIDQIVGMRFNGMSIPQGATIVNAYVQFQADEALSGPTSLTIQGEDIDNALTFTSSSGNISSRPTTAGVTWSPPPWLTVGEAGVDQRTPNITSVIQEIVNRPGWSSGNSMVIIITGTGERVAESYNGNPAGAPLLHVAYKSGPPNNPPVANDDAASTAEDTAVMVNVTVNDFDPDGNLDPATVNTSCTGCSETSNGSLVNLGNGSFEYAPNPDYNGPDSFVYEICDTLSACDTALVDITVDPVNDQPVANDDAASTAEDTAVMIIVVANDSDPDGNLDPTSANTTCVGCANPGSGSLANHGDGSFEYTPDFGFSGPDNFVYEVCDSDGLCDIALVSITVNLVNDPPMANDDSASTAEDTAVWINAAVNDNDPDGNINPASTNTTCGDCTNPGNGSLVNLGDGSFEYTPNPDYNGADSFVYEICDTLGACDTAVVNITVDPVNDPPVANDDAASTAEDTAVSMDVVANDSDPDGNLDPTSTNTTCVGCTNPGSGSLVNYGDGSFEYSPNPGFSGSDTFVYEVCDSDLTCDTAQVSITVNSSTPNIVEVRVSASSDDAEQRSTRMYLTSSDLELVYDGSDQTVGMRFNGMSIPQGVTIVNAYVQFQADEVLSGPTSLTIQGEDDDNAETFTISRSNISSRIKTTAAVVWTPVAWTTAGEAGIDQRTPNITTVIQEIVNRPGWSNGNSMVIIITGTGERVAESYNGTPTGAPMLHVEYNAGPPNNPPVANDDAANTAEDTAVMINVAVNDTDPDGNLDPESVNTVCSTCAETSNGNLVNPGDGSLEYTPNPNYNGPDSFVYEICDTLGACDTALVDITVDPVNDQPVANGDAASTAEDTAVTMDVVVNDSDPDGNLDPASTNTTCGGCANPDNGSLANHGDGSFEYTPNPGFTGPDSFVYEICDSAGLCDTAVVNITVTPTNDPPVANDDSASTAEDTAVWINAAVNDNDPDGNLDTSSTNTDCPTCAVPSNGNLVNYGDGSFEYAPNPNFNGPDSFVYEICDTLGACDTAIVDITVDPVNDLPVANDDAASTDEDTVMTINVVANDSDPDGNLNPASTNTSCTECSEAGNGNLVNNGDGTIEYAPNAGFNGPDSFVYEVCDTDLACDTAVVSITVNPSTPTIIEVRVSASSDDAEERSAERMRLTSSDLDLVYDGIDQMVGMRFNGMSIPQGATIVNAYVQFQADETHSGPTSLTIQGEDVDHAETFTSTRGNISSRIRTTAGVAWTSVAWTTVGEAGIDQRTPNITTVIQEIVNRSGWLSGNSMVVIITGTGERVAESYNGNEAGAPLLHVEYAP